MIKVHIATSRPKEIGDRCWMWARQNLPDGFELVDDPDECDIFISVLYDTLLTPTFLEGRRCYNFHPGILPDYRGSGTYSWVLLNEDNQTGVTLHEIDPDIDSGPIISIRQISIGERDTAQVLFERCMGLLFNMFVECFPFLLSGKYDTIPNKEGNLYLRKHLEEKKDISHIIRAFTFEGKESAYWYDSKGNKQYVEWK